MLHPKYKTHPYQPQLVTVATSYQVNSGWVLVRLILQAKPFPYIHISIYIYIYMLIGLYSHMVLFIYGGIGINLYIYLLGLSGQILVTKVGKVHNIWVSNRYFGVKTTICSVGRTACKPLKTTPEYAPRNSPRQTPENHQKIYQIIRSRYHPRKTPKYQY